MNILQQARRTSFLSALDFGYIIYIWIWRERERERDRREELEMEDLLPWNISNQHPITLFVFISRNIFRSIVAFPF
jgi:hypothetical protein